MKEYVIKTNKNIELILSPSQSAESISKYFTLISQEYQPLNLDCISTRVREFLTLPAMASGRGPLLSEHEVYMKIKSANKPNSHVKGDINPKLMKSFFC